MEKYHTFKSRQLIHFPVTQIWPILLSLLLLLILPRTSLTMVATVGHLEYMGLIQHNKLKYLYGTSLKQELHL
jgi:ABC-type enterochelin transport system permease subunit